jgi:hypothetical protein
MEGKVAFEEHFSTGLNNRHWNAKGEEDRNGKVYAREVERRLLDPKLVSRKWIGAASSGAFSRSLPRGVQSVIDPQEAVAVARDANDCAHKSGRSQLGECYGLSIVGAALDRRGLG